MACHEIAALRLGLMTVLGRRDEAERQHEVAELGAAAEAPGPLRALAQAADLTALRSSYDDALGALAEQVARTPADHPKLPYLRALLVLTKKVELELALHVDAFARFYADLE